MKPIVVPVFIACFASIFLLSISEIFRISFLATAQVAFSYLHQFWILTLTTIVFLFLLSSQVRTTGLNLLRGVVLSIVYILMMLPLLDEGTVVEAFSVQMLLGFGWVFCFCMGIFWKKSTRWELIFSILAFVTSIVFFATDLTLFPDQYFGVHEVLLSAAFVGLMLSTRFFYTRIDVGPIRWGFLIASALGVGLICTGFFSEEDIVSEYRAESQLGKALSSVESEREYEAISGEFFSENPIALYREKSGFQNIDADLEDYNVVFVLSETTRADDTYLNNKKVNFTPNLKLFSKKSMVYENAMAPSSGTFQSVSSIFSMLPPTMAPIDLWSQHWLGELRPERASVVDLFQKSGWRTAWIGHDFHHFFSQDKIRGFERGFDVKDLEPVENRKSNKGSDARTAKRAVKYIKERAKKDERFFLFTFFDAPHAGYETHYKKMPKKTQRQRYRQEVSFVDEQFGKILNAIKEGGIEKKTIVIFAGDHGEAFGEHKTHRHNSQLYRESVHVPLAVFVPETTASRHSKPVSLFSVFPNLMLGGPKQMQSEVKQVIKDDLAPLHVAMGQGAFSELIRLKKMATRVDMGDRVLIYFHVSGQIHRFEDRAEKKVLPPTAEDQDIIDRLGRLRSTRKRFTKKTKYSPWKRFKKKSKDKK